AHLGGDAFRIASPGCTRTHVGADTEVLEGGGGNDRLFGDSRDNPLILGREGADLLVGGPGDDLLRGLSGSDTYDGGAGADELDAQAGPNDNDVQIDCGPGGIS